ncbi:hypothetical protein ACMDB5_13160 [Flavobacterium sp. W1B]|uniref:hypothetical protein n=1 Tax=Flavobacterium sp. W1B TaxID=3394146 RepID=UPI0039BC9BB5
MISKIHILKEKLLFSTKQGNAWRLRRATEIDPTRRETINLIIAMIDDDKDYLRKKLQQQKATN